MRNHHASSELWLGELQSLVESRARRVVRGQRAASELHVFSANFPDRRVRRREQTYRLIKQLRLLQIRPVPGGGRAGKEIAQALCNLSRYPVR